MVKGIDVSYAQGLIDWKKVKKAGIDFAFIRIGYGKIPETQKDARFEGNYAGAMEAGIPIGGYHYSYATDVLGAQQEAQACIKMLSGKKFDLPIAYDLEEAKQYALNPNELYSIYKAFEQEMELAGHRVILYTNLNWMRNKWSKTEIIQDGTKIWMAQYSSSMDTTYKDIVSIWQYTSSGSVAGISGKVDRNYSYIGIKELKGETMGKADWIEEDGKWWYRHADGTYTSNNWEQIEGKWYFFDTDGWMQTGWLELEGKWYYLESNGAMVANTLYKVGEELYAFGEDGHMLRSNDRGALA